MNRYPFIIERRKAIVVEATSLSNAMDRVVARYQNKWIRTKHARNVAKHLENMDLINAQQKVKADSKAKKGIMFYIILVDDEFEVKDYKSIDLEKDDVYSAWRDGVKIDSPKENKEETKNETTMKTKNKKVAAPKKEKAAKVVKEKKVKVEKKKLGASCFVDAAQEKTLAGILKAAGDISFNAWVNQLVSAKLK